MNITSHCEDCGHTWATDEWADCLMCGGLPDPDEEPVDGWGGSVFELVWGPLTALAKVFIRDPRPR